MNFLALSVVFGFLGGVAFFFFGQAGAMTDSASILLSFQAIIAAAVLVRLNRGVPSIDWKSVDAEPLRRLLDRLEEIAKVYIIIVSKSLLSIVIIISLIYINKVDFDYKETVVEVISSTFGVILGLLISRMAYVVWLDLDIVRLQRAVILSAAENDEVKAQTKLAEDRLKNMSNARITTL